MIDVIQIKNAIKKTTYPLQFGNNPFSALGGGSESGVQPSRTENREPLPNPWGPPNASNPPESAGGGTAGGTGTGTPAAGTNPTVSNPLGVNPGSLGNGKMKTLDFERRHPAS